MSFRATMRHEAAVPHGWTQVTLGDLADYHNGRAFKKSEWRKAGRPIIRIQNLTDPTKSFNYFQGDVEPRHEVRAGDVLVSWAATLGVFRWDGPDAVLNQHIFKVVPKPGISPQFLYYLLQSIIGDLRSQAHGSGMVHITKGRFLSTPVFLPPLAQQVRIVEAVESAMAAIAEVERAFDAAERSLALLELSAMHQVFQSRSGSRWQTRPLGDVADHALGKMLDREKNEGIPRPYLRNVNVQWGRITLDDVKEMRIRDSEVERYRVRRGDLLVCEGGEPGRCAIWEHDEPMFFQKALHRIRPSEELDTSFLAVYLRYLALTGGLDVHLTGSTIKHLPGQRLARIPIPLPPLKEQRDIVHQLQRQRELLDTSRKYLEQVGKRLGAFRQSVLRQAFSGRLVLQDETDEPAGRLLQRLRAEKAERPGAMKLPRPPRQDARSRGLRNRAASASGVTNRD